MQWNCRNIVTFLHKIQKLKPFIRKIRQTQIDEHSSKLSRSLKTRKHQEMIIVWRLKDMRPPRWCCGKEPSCQCRRHKRCRFDPWVRKSPWRRAWQPTPVFLPTESHGQRGLTGYSPQGHEESDKTEVTWHACTQRHDQKKWFWTTFFYYK